MKQTENEIAKAAVIFFIPGVGPLLIAGPILTWIIGALESAVVIGGLSVIGAALVSIGIPQDRTLVYETEIKAGKFIVVAHGTAHELGAIRDTLGATSQQYKPALAVAA